jgi:hypothetical protein
MPDSTLPERVTVLEQKVEELASLPSRVGALELQIGQLRDEMRVEFSAVRAEIREGDEETRRYMRVLHEEVISRIATLAESRRPRGR